MSDRSLSARVAVVTPERTPLEVFGPAVGAAVCELLAARGVFVEHSTRPRSVSRGGLELADGGLVPADRVIAIPRLMGRRLSGVPADWSGFVMTDEDSRVEDLPSVFAAGDMTRFPVKQSGLATQQADVIAAQLARRAGVNVPHQPTRYVLRTQLIGTDGPLYLQAELAAGAARSPAHARRRSAPRRHRGRPPSSSAGTSPRGWPRAPVRRPTPRPEQRCRSP